MGDMTDDLLAEEERLFAPLTPPNPAAPKPKCRRHQRLPVHFALDRPDLWHVEQNDGGKYCEPGIICTSCWKRLDPAASRRGKNNKTRGIALQNVWLARLGLTPHPDRHGPIDGENGMFVAQAKSGGRFSETDYTDMVRMPVRAGQTRLLVKIETPGPGRRARATVTMPAEDFIALHGPVTK